MVKQDIIHAAGTQQTCAGLESGIEAAVSGKALKMRRECILINRKVSLESIKKLCFSYLNNNSTPARLLTKLGLRILSQESVPQGDNAEMTCFSSPHHH